MSNVTGNIWSAQIPAVIVNPPGVKYYIEALDASPSPNRAVLPAAAPTTFFDFTVGSGDTSPPTIAVTPVPNDRPAGSAVVVTANIADAISRGIFDDAARLGWRRLHLDLGATWQSLADLIDSGSFNVARVAEGICRDLYSQLQASRS